ncbi:hypothetical protein D3Z52_05710 [Clostridiaceae bacterium]|nr:hypothetical protein [Clostridiaceae bacterium]
MRSRKQENESPKRGQAGRTASGGLSRLGGHILILPEKRHIRTKQPVFETNLRFFKKEEPGRNVKDKSGKTCQNGNIEKNIRNNIEKFLGGMIYEQDKDDSRPGNRQVPESAIY